MRRHFRRFFINLIDHITGTDRNLLESLLGSGHTARW